jgi:hypothetical protein
MSNDDEKDTDETESFDVIDFVDYRKRKMQEENADEFNQDQFDLGLYLVQLAKEEREYKRKQKIRRIKDLTMLFYCFMLTVILMCTLLSS